MANDTTNTTETTWADDDVTEAQPEPDKPAITRLDPPAKLDIPADAHLAPPELDPYFVKRDGTKITGEGAKTKSASKTTPKPSEPEPAEDAEADDADASDEQPERIGDAWLEVQREKREAEQLRQSVEAERERIAAAEREAAEARERYEADERELSTDLHSFLHRKGLSFRELVMADLERADAEQAEEQRRADPRYQEIEQARAEAAAAIEEANQLKAEIAAREEREEAVAYEQAVAADANDLRAILADLPDAKAITAYGLDATIAEVQAHRERHFVATGEVLEYADLFAAAERELRARADRYSQIEAEPEQDDDEPAPEPAPTRKRGPVTLTNRTAAARHSGPRIPSAPGEDRARAIAYRTLRLRDEHGNLH